MMCCAMAELVCVSGNRISTTSTGLWDYVDQLPGDVITVGSLYLRRGDEKELVILCGLEKSLGNLL